MNKSIQLCFEILGRYFPEQSGREQEAKKLFGLPESRIMTTADWKKAACDWLASNLSVKKSAAKKKVAAKK